MSCFASYRCFLVLVLEGMSFHFSAEERLGSDCHFLRSSATRAGTISGLIGT